MMLMGCLGASEVLSMRGTLIRAWSGPQGRRGFGVTWSVGSPQATERSEACPTDQVMRVHRRVPDRGLIRSDASTTPGATYAAARTLSNVLTVATSNASVLPDTARHRLRSTRLVPRTVP